LGSKGAIRTDIGLKTQQQKYDDYMTITLQFEGVRVRLRGYWHKKLRDNEIKWEPDRKGK
jgi:hypothetical protein